MAINDPRLMELYEAGDADDEVAVILRLEKDAVPPPTLRIVARFGDVATGRVRRGDIYIVRQSPGIISLKAGRQVTLPRMLEGEVDEDAFSHEDEADDEARVRAAPSQLAPYPVDGKGVVVGICDWGFDFTHSNFRNADGTTRLQALWDQRGTGDPLAPAPYNKGRLLTRAAINNALGQLDPCASLGYHPASGDPARTGSHGTHVADILCGNRREPGSEVGLASGSDIVFVHLASPNLSELANLGDSVGLLEGLDFIRREAAGRPCVLHLSAGKTGGPHRGTTLLERAVDTMLEQPGIVLIQSVGNYADSAMHTLARIGPDQRHSLDWMIPQADRTSNELEIWYNGQDVFDVTLTSPDGREFSTKLDSRIRLGDRPSWGNFYHRRHEPNSGLNHIVVFLYTAAPSGRWRVTLHGRDVVDGRMHAWIERDASARYQSRFPRSQATSKYTTNTICNCYRAIAVGAYDATQAERPPTHFSSRGPTADGRQKPEVAAPGYKIRAARSMPRDGWRGERKLTVKSGTSMAAPWVSGTVALMMAAAGRLLTIHEIRRALIGSVDPHPGPSGRTSTQLGYGYLNTARAIEAARRIGQGEAAPPVVARTPAPASVSAAQPRVDDRDLDAMLGEPRVWVEDIATGEDLLEDEGLNEALILETVTAAAEVLASEDVESSESAAAETAVVETAAVEDAVEEMDVEDCGCGGRARATPDRPHESDTEDEAWDEEMSFEAPDESAGVPFEWAEVQEALEAVDENVG